MSPSTLLIADEGKVFINEGSASFVGFPTRDSIKFAHKIMKSPVHNKSLLGSHIESSDIRMKYCNNPACGAKAEANAIWDRFRAIGLISINDDGKEYIVDAAKENPWFVRSVVTNMITVNKGSKVEEGPKKEYFIDPAKDNKYSKQINCKFSNITWIFHELMMKRKSYADALPEEQHEMITVLRDQAHDLLMKYIRLKEEYHPSYAAITQIYSAENIYCDKDNRYRSHDDPMYDSRHGDTTLVCPVCGSENITLEKADTYEPIQHEVVYTNTLSEHDTYLVQEGGFHYLFENDSNDSQNIEEYHRPLHGYISAERRVDAFDAREKARENYEAALETEAKAFHINPQVSFRELQAKLHSSKATQLKEELKDCTTDDMSWM